MLTETGHNNKYQKFVFVFLLDLKMHINLIKTNILLYGIILFMYALTDVAGSSRRVGAGSLGIFMIVLSIFFFNNNIYKLYIFKNNSKKGRELHMRYIIHVEKIYDDEVWNKLTKFLKKKGKRTHLFLMAPQPTYLKANLAYRGSKEELVEKMSKRYKMLAQAQSKYKFKVGLHMHLSINPQEISEEEKDHSVKYVYKWVKRFFKQDVDTIAFGWFKYDKYTEDLCKKNKIKIINDQWGAITFHDYDLPLSSNKVFEKWLRVVLRKLRGQKPKA